MNDIVIGLFERGVPSLLLSLGRFFFYEMIVYYFMSKLLPNRLNTCWLIALSLVYTLWSNLRSPALYGTAYHLWMNIFINAWTVFILLFFFKGKFWQRAIVYWYFDIIKTMCEAAAYVPILLYDAYRGLHSEWGGIISFMESSMVPNLLYIFTFLSLFLVLGFFALKMWRRLLLKKFELFYLLFIILPMGQQFSLALVVHPNMGNPLFGIFLKITPDVNAVYHNHALIGILLCLAADLVLLVYAISQEKRTAMEGELREIRYQMELEQSHYRELELRREELVKIRHDFNNQLASIGQLIRLGEDGPARELIDSLEAEINKPE